MSSLLQFRGKTSRKGVHLQFIQIEKYNEKVGNPDLPIGHPDRGFVWERERYTDTFTDPTTGRPLPFIWEAPRVPCGMLGCWVQFRYNGKVHVPDLSVPISIERMPRDAVKLSQEESLQRWHS